SPTPSEYLSKVTGSAIPQCVFELGPKLAAFLAQVTHNLLRSCVKNKHGGQFAPGERRVCPTILSTTELPLDVGCWVLDSFLCYPTASAPPGLHLQQPDLSIERRDVVDHDPEPVGSDRLG